MKIHSKPHLKCNSSNGQNVNGQNGYEFSLRPKTETAKTVKKNFLRPVKILYTGSDYL